MFLVALYFLCVTIISHGIGVGLSKLFFNQISVTDRLFLGLAGITVLASLWAVWLPLDYRFTMFIVLLSLFFSITKTNFKQTSLKFKEYLTDFKKLSLFIFILLTVALAASLPAYAIDNEAYYIQTIKWLDQHGLVIGLGNLHHFFYQQSGVHILQSALNFDSIYDRFNDISAFFLFIGLCWSAFAKAESTSNLINQFKSLFPIALFLFLLFSTAPTSDIPVYVLSYYAIYKFLVLWGKDDDSQLLLLSIVCILIAYFKITGVLIFILPLVLIFKKTKQRSFIFLKIISVGLVFLALFLIKNTIVSGLPFYPITTWTPVDFSWQVDLGIANHYKQLTAAQPFHKWPTVLAEIDFLGKVKLWLLYPAVDTILNWFTVLSFFASINIIWKSKWRPLQIICTVFILQSSILFLKSPQFRFFLNLLYPVVVLMFLYWCQPTQKVKRTILTLGYTAGLLLFIAPQLISSLTDNPAMKNNIKLESFMLIDPSPVSKYSSEAYETNEGNLKYYHSKEDERIWNTNDVPLPGVQKQYIDYYKKYFNSRPQLRSADLKDGFYSDTGF